MDFKKQIRGFFRDSSVYGLGTALAATASFLLIPIYTTVLPKEEYGQLQLIYTSSEFLAVAMLAGVRQAFIRFYFDDSSPEWHRKLMGTTATLVLMTSALVSLAFLPFRGTAAGELLDDPGLAFLFDLVLVWVVAEIFFGLGLSLLQVKRRPVLFILFSLAKLSLVIGSNVVLVYFQRRGIAGILFSNAWVSAFFGTSVLAFFLVRSRFSVAVSLGRKLLRFGLPYLPAAFFLFVMMSSPVVALKQFAGLGAVGIYGLAVKVSIFGAMLLVEPFGKVWAPFVFDNYNKERGPELIGRLFTAFCIVSVGLGVAVSIAAPIVIPLIAGNPEFHASASLRIVPILCVAMMFLGMGNAADVGILIAKKTYLKPWILGPAAAVSVVLNVALVPFLHAHGAAIASMMAYLVFFVMNLVVSRRYYRFNLETGRILFAFISGCAVYGVFELLYWASPEELRFLSATAFLLYPVFVFFYWRRPLVSEPVTMQPVVAEDE